jgi:hypothetical protein
MEYDARMSNWHVADWEPGRGESHVLAWQDSRARERLSGPALRAFFSLMERWGLGANQARGLLGWIPESTYFKYKGGEAGSLSYDGLTRISLCLGIFKALRTFFAEPQLADRWMTLPNSNPLFGGRAPIDFVLDRGIDGLYQVRRLLESRLQ